MVTRGPGPDGRTSAVALTSAGHRLARAVTAARAHVLRGALAQLDEQERQTLDRLAGQVLAGLVREPGATGWICRLCDTGACGRATGDCPVAAEAGRRFG